MSARDPFGPRWLHSQLMHLVPGFPDTLLCVAVSGGADSTALLAAAAQLPGLKLRALHVDHGVQAQSKDWSAHCRRLAVQLKIPLEVLSTQVTPVAGESLEEQMREARYALLAAHLTEGEVLLTAHHQDDQLETVLLQLLRGAGVSGLAAMAQISPFPPGLLARPLLSRRRAELTAWLQQEGLPWVEDSSNEDERFERNYLRRRIIPLIRARWPGAAGAVARSARHAHEARVLLEELAVRDLAHARHGRALKVTALRALPAARRRNALRRWITESGHRPPDTRRLIELAGPLLAARADANPELVWGDSIVRRHAGRLTLGRIHAQGAPLSMPWRWGEERCAWAAGTLALTADSHGPVSLAALPQVLTVRVREGGERLVPVRGGPRRSVKSLLQEARVSPAVRAQLPLIYADGTLVAVADLWLDESVQADGLTHLRGRLSWEPAAPP